MSWLGHSPRELGYKEFFRRYLEIAPERFEKYFTGQWGFTNRLEAQGQKILLKEVVDEVSLMLFLIQVAVWKEPYEPQAKEIIRQVINNSYAEIRSVFDQVWLALTKHLDRAAIDAVGSLKGFGIGGSRKIASAVLRFLDPSRFAVVDYRNWAILSNTEGKYFEKPLLKPLAPTIEETRDRPIGTEKYCEYLKVVRELAYQVGIRAADVDVALFAFSPEVRPLSVNSATEESEVTTQDSRVADSYQALKYQKMVEVVMRVVNDNKRKGHSRAAQTLETGLRKCRTPREIFEMCYNMTTKASYMDTYLAASGTMTLRQIMNELKSIYQDP